MSTMFILRPGGISLMTLIVMSALLTPSAFAQAPPFLLEWGTLESPSGVAVDAGGHVYVSDLSNGRIQKFTAAGAYISQWSAGGIFPVGVAVERPVRTPASFTRPRA